MKAKSHDAKDNKNNSSRKVLPAQFQNPAADPVPSRAAGVKFLTIEIRLGEGII